MPVHILPLGIEYSHHFSTIVDFNLPQQAWYLPVADAPQTFPYWPILLVVAILIPLMIVAFQKFTNK